MLPARPAPAAPGFVASLSSPSAQCAQSLRTVGRRCNSETALLLSSACGGGGTNSSVSLGAAAAILAILRASTCSALRCLAWIAGSPIAKAPHAAQQQPSCNEPQPSGQAVQALRVGRLYA